MVFQGSTTTKDIAKALDLKVVKLSFGEGSRGGRGAQNKGMQFEVDLTNDLNKWWQDEKLGNVQEKIINEINHKWHKVKKFVVSNEGGLNQRRPLIFQGNHGTAKLKHSLYCD